MVEQARSSIMDMSKVLKGVMLGALLGGAWSGVRQYGARRNQRPPLAVLHESIESLDIDLLELFQDFQEYAKVLPPAQRPRFQNLLNEAIKSAERQLCIELQIENQEIVAHYRDYNEAERLALTTMEWLRQAQELFQTNPDMYREVRDKGTSVAAQLSQHLNNIATECSAQ